MDVILTIGRFFYDAVHLTAALMTVFLMDPVLAVTGMGLGAWGLSALWLALFLLDRTGRISLHGSFGKLAAGVLLPAVMSSGEFLFREEMFSEDFPFPPQVYLCFCLLLLLLGSILFRGPSEGKNQLHRAELLLERGCELAIPEIIWLHLLGGAVLLVAVLGFLLVIILGELMAQRNSLFNYGGLAGMLAALSALHLAQVLMFWRGLRLAKREAPDQTGRWSLLLLWVPVANLFWAGRLRSRLRQRRMEEENPAWNRL